MSFSSDIKHICLRPRAADTTVNVQNVVYSDVTVSNSDAGIMIKSYPDNASSVFTLSAH